MLVKEFSRVEITNQQKIALAEQVFPLFTTNSQLRTPFAVDVLKARIAESPDMLGEFDVFQGILLNYFPKPSLTRNYFLDVWENSRFTLTPSQLTAINELRLSEEGKRHEADDSPLVFLFDRLSEVNRAEKITTLTWLMGISPEKSIPIKNIESELDGHLDNLPKAFAVLTPNEREVLLYRLLLGAEGILDLQAVPDDRRPQAEQQRKEFLETIGAKFFGGTPNPSLFQNMFATMSISSTPAHATQVLTKLINQMYEAELQQRALLPEEALTIALTEMGVVGKKIAQYIAELDWIKQYPEYQRALRKAQEEGPVVPRNALLTFAEADGLLDTTKPYSIVAFGPSLGSASNKQANLVTIAVRNPDNDLGLPVGEHQLVYKVMRPSAQKGNLGHDLKVLQAVYNALPSDQIAGKLPPDFLLEIEDTVTRELNFRAEQTFNAQMRAILEFRNYGKEIPITMPRIVLATDNSMLETVASGKSLRTIYDLQEASHDDQREIMLHKIEEAVLIESLSQILNGNFHVDLHPGNIFIDYDEASAMVRQISFIDWGMREELAASEKQPTINMLIALATGDEASLKQSMQQLGWTNAEAIALELQATGNYPQDFAQNALKLLTTSRNLDGVPRTLMSIILATAKLETYAHHIDPSVVLTALMSNFIHS